MQAYRVNRQKFFNAVTALQYTAGNLSIAIDEDAKTLSIKTDRSKIYEIPLEECADMRPAVVYDLCEAHEKKRVDYQRKLEDRTVLWGERDALYKGVQKCSDCKQREGLISRAHTLCLLHKDLDFASYEAVQNCPQCKP